MNRDFKDIDGGESPICSNVRFICKIKQLPELQKKIDTKKIDTFLRRKYFEISNAPSRLTSTAVFVMLRISMPNIP